MTNEVNPKVSSYRLIRRFLYGIVIFIIIIYSLHLYLRFQSEKERKEVSVFLKQIISSMKNDLVYYKEHASDSALRDLEFTKNDIDKLNGPNDIKIVDLTFGTYECRILFADNVIFKADVSLDNDSPILVHFLMLKKNQK